MDTRHAKNQGMNWIRKEKRLAIYLRDGLACCYCGEGIEDGAKLTLDHLTPHCQGGSNHESNLVTCCHRCNSRRGKRDWREFAATVAAYLNHGIQPEQITGHIEETITRKINLTAAKDVMTRRGSFTQAMNR